jgi:hypothetical protein
MASAMVASSVSRLISAPLYPSLAELQLLRIKNVVESGNRSVEK